MEKEKHNKVKKRIVPESIFFFRRENNKNERWFEIFLNGGYYPTISDAQKMLKTFTEFVEYLEKLGQDKIDKINKEIEENFIKEQNEIVIPKVKEKKSGYIYLIKSKNLYKIGRAKYPKSRFKTYKTENPFRTEVIFQKEVDDYIGVEAELLKKFQDKKYRGEWFKLNQEDVDLIKEFLK